MGTRADFYVGRGKDAVWLGSIAWDGYPEGIDESITKAKSEEEYKAAVQEWLAGRDDASHPNHGWPWPWNDSRTTDYAYAWDGGLFVTIGRAWVSFEDQVKWNSKEDGDEDENPLFKGPDAEFPDMSSRKNVTLGKRSGLLVFGMKREDDDADE